MLHPVNEILYVFMHTEIHLTGAVILLLVRVPLDITWGAGPRAAQAAASHLELNINIMANKIIPFP